MSKEIDKWDEERQRRVRIEDEHMEILRKESDSVISHREKIADQREREISQREESHNDWKEEQGKHYMINVELLTQYKRIADALDRIVENHTQGDNQ